MAKEKRLRRMVQASLPIICQVYTSPVSTYVRASSSCALMESWSLQLAGEQHLFGKLHACPRSQAESEPVAKGKRPQHMHGPGRPPNYSSSGEPRTRWSSFKPADV